MYYIKKSFYTIISTEKYIRTISSIVRINAYTNLIARLWVMIHSLMRMTCLLIANRRSLRWRTLREVSWFSIGCLLHRVIESFICSNLYLQFELWSDPFHTYVNMKYYYYNYITCMCVYIYKILHAWAQKICRSPSKEIKSHSVVLNWQKKSLYLLHYREHITSMNVKCNEHQVGGDDVKYNHHTCHTRMQPQPKPIGLHINPVIKIKA